MRNVAVVTVARSDYSIYLPVLREIEAQEDLGLHVIAGGMHLSPEFGMTVRCIESDGFDVVESVEMLLSSDTPLGVSTSTGLGVIGFAQAYARCRPDLIVVLGDRFEMHAAALAALPLRIPLAHIHGGELTEGAMDDALRHSITKLSHLHFVATETYARRVMQLGEEPWRVYVTGAPGLDNLRTFEPMDRRDLEAHIGLPFDQPPLLITYHPVTLDDEAGEQWQVDELLSALREIDRPLVFTMPNADAGGRAIAAAIAGFVDRHPRARLVVNAGTRLYLSLMAGAGAMVGNSSSGIIEAASFGLPVVNIGSRQRGRLRAENVIDVGNEHAVIADGIRRALDPAFRERLRGLPNPFGSGEAAGQIVHVLRTVPLDARLTQKRFFDAVDARFPSPARVDSVQRAAL